MQQVKWMQLATMELVCGVEAAVVEHLLSLAHHALLVLLAYHDHHEVVAEVVEASTQKLSLPAVTKHVHVHDRDELAINSSLL